MTVYLDINVSSNLGDGESSPEEMAQISRILGFSGLGFADFSRKNNSVKFKEILSHLPLKAYSRVNLNFDSVTKNRKILNQMRRTVDIVAVACLNRRVAVWAARDPDVDLLYFPDVKMCKQVDKSLIGLVYSSGNAVEISVRPILLSKGLRRANTLGILRKTVEIVLKGQASLVLTSDAHTKFELRSPRGLAALGKLLDVPYDKAMEALSNNPLKILEHRSNSN
ncbi:MAG: RNase P subunit p30 family protein [Candidatus Jordarchaeum sp.]|uniref:RNase P subunit p30 family protein n=1 Tax=Candidatus Jordarchaeum sp. TaxID=2823881 RepID=UPI00404A1F14